MNVRVLRGDQFTERELARWTELEARALEPNPYVSAAFLGAALRHLPEVGPARTRVLIVEGAGGAELLGVGVFQEGGPRARFPLPHLRAIHTPHSYVGGLCLDRERAAEAADALVEVLGRSRRWPAVGFRDLSWDGRLAQVLRDAFARRGAAWYEVDRVPRAVLAVRRRRGQAPAAYVSKSVIKNFRRLRSKLDRMGAVTWRCLTGAQITPEVIETFLRLEHTGWKGAVRTSLLSRSGHADFFREVMTAFAGRGDAFFTELAVDGRVVASTANLLAGGEGFAFKIAFDAELEDASPGFLNEMRFLEEGPPLDVSVLDSGAAPGSFIERLWPDRTTLASGYFVTRPLARAAVRGLHLLRGVKRALRARRTPGGTDGKAAGGEGALRFQSSLT